MTGVELVELAYQVWLAGAVLVAVGLFALIGATPWLATEPPERLLAVTLLTACLWPILVPFAVEAIRESGRWR